MGNKTQNSLTDSNKQINNLFYALIKILGGNKMKHESKETIKSKDLLMAEAVIKGLILKGEIKRAIEICDKHNIDAKRFGELTKIATEQ